MIVWPNYGKDGSNQLVENGFTLELIYNSFFPIFVLEL